MPEFLENALGHGSGIAFDADGDGVVAPDFLGIDLNLNDLRIGGDEAVIVKGGGLAKAGANGQDDVGFTDGLDSLGRAETAEMPEEIWVVGGHGVGPAVGGHYTRAGQFRKPTDYTSRVAPLHSATCQDYRALGGCEHVRGALDQPQVSARAGLAGPVGIGGKQVQLHLSPRQQVAGDVQQYGPHLARRGHAEGVAQRVGQAVDAVDGECRLGDGLEERDLVELLGGGRGSGRGGRRTAR